MQTISKADQRTEDEKIVQVKMVEAELAAGSGPRDEGMDL